MVAVFRSVLLVMTVEHLARSTSGFFAAVRSFGTSGGLGRVLWNWSDSTRVTLTAVVGLAYLLIISLLNTPGKHTMWSTLSVWLLVLLHMPSVLHSLAMLGLDEQHIQKKHDSHGRQRPILSILASVLLFAGIYAVMNSNGTGEGDFGLQLKHPRGSLEAIFEAVYLSVTVATTTGFGDVTPSSVSGYMIFGIQQLISWVYGIALLGHVMASLLPLDSSSDGRPVSQKRIQRLTTDFMHSNPRAV